MRALARPEQPKNFEDVIDYAFEHQRSAHADKTSVWAYGAPMTVQDMLNRANRITTRTSWPRFVATAQHYTRTEFGGSLRG